MDNVMDVNAQQITYDIEPDIDLDQVIELWQQSSSANIDSESLDTAALKRLFDNSNLIVSARDDGQLIGLTRSVTDFGLYCGLVDMLIHKDYPQQQLTKELTTFTRIAAGNNVWLNVVAPASARNLYQSVGFQEVTQDWNAWVLTPPIASNER